MELDYKQIGVNIARRREELHLKQVEVCEKADLNDKYLPVLRLHALSQALKCFYASVRLLIQLLTTC